MIKLLHGLTVKTPPESANKGVSIEEGIFGLIERFEITFNRYLVIY